MEVKFHTTKLTCGQNGYGINFKGGSPVHIDTVLPSSPAEHGGLRFGDMLVELNGNDIFSFSKESVISAIKACNKGMLRIKVGRVRPIPVTADTRREAVRLVKNKLESGSKRPSVQVQQYQDQLNNSLADVEDLLKSFDLPMPVMTGQQAAKPVPKSTPVNALSSTARESKEGEMIQELELELYDDHDSLPSPPSSTNSSEADPKEKDPLLDFSTDDYLTYSSQGTKQKATTAKPASRQLDGSERPQMMKATMELQRGLEGLKNILQDAGRTYDEKQNKRRIALAEETSPRQVTTVASFPQPRQGRGVVSDGRDTAPAAATQREKRNIPQPLNIETREPVSVGSSSGREYGSFDQPAVSSPTWKNVAPTRNPPSPVRVAPAPPRVAPASSSKAMPSPSKKRFPPQPSVPSSHSSVAATTAIPPTATSVPARPHPKQSPSPPISKPAPYSGSMMSPTSHSSRAGGSVELLSRQFEKQKRPEVDQEAWRGSQKDRTRLPPPSRAPILAATGAVYTSVDRSHSPSSSPPPVPVYNPTQPDMFLLSNQRGYLKMDDKKQKQRHSSGEDKQEESRFAQQREVVGGRGPADVVPVRTKNTKNELESLPSGEEGVVKELKGSGGRGRFEVQPAASAQKTNRIVVDVTPLELACSGLPDSVTDWSHGDVMLWLRQLSPSLFELCSDNFSRHDIIGRALLRLNAAKLKKMDINSKHSTVLASEIVKLKIRQEKMELEELEPNQLSYL